YIGHIISRTRQPRLRPLWVPVKNIQQGRGSSARRLCHRKRVKRVFPRVLKKSPRPAAAQPKAVPGLPSRIPGKPPRPRLQNPQKTKEAQCQTRLPKLPRKRPVRRPLLRRLLPPRLPRRPLRKLRSSRSLPASPPQSLLRSEERRV